MVSLVTVGGLMGPRSSGGPVQAYERNIIDAGGSISATSLGYVETFYRGLVDDGLWGKLLDVGLLMGDDLTSALVKFKAFPGSGDSAANTNFINGDYAEGAGLTNTNTDEYLDLGFAPADLPNSNSITLAGYFNACAAGGAKLGAEDPMDITIRAKILPIFGSAAFGDLYRNNAGGRATASVASGAGLTAVTRSSATLLTLYKNGSPIATNTGSSIGTPPSAQNFRMFLDQLAFSPSVATGCFWAIGEALTDADHANLDTRVTTLQTSLGRAA